MKKWVKWLKIHQNQVILYFFILILIIILLSVFFNFVKMVMVILILAFINAFLRFYRRILPGLPIELEISILGAVVCTIAYNVWAGVIYALLSSILAELFNQYISPFSLVNIIVYALTPFAALFLSASSLVAGGIVIAVIANIIIYIIFMAVGYDVFKNTAYGITNVIWNWIIFTSLAVPLLNLIS